MISPSRSSTCVLALLVSCIYERAYACFPLSLSLSLSLFASLLQMPFYFLCPSLLGRAFPRPRCNIRILCLLCVCRFSSCVKRTIFFWRRVCVTRVGTPLISNPHTPFIPPPSLPFPSLSALSPAHDLPQHVFPYPFHYCAFSVSFLCGSPSANLLQKKIARRPVFPTEDGVSTLRCWLHTNHILSQNIYNL